MDWLERQVRKWNEFVQKPRPGMEKAGRFLRKLKINCTALVDYIYKLRGLILAVPTATVAIVLAAINNTRLPETVETVLPSIDLEAADAILGFLVYRTEYIPRSTAVFAPAVLTLACLLLMLCSKRVLYPWMISLFSLVIPLFLLLTNVYLA